MVVAAMVKAFEGMRVVAAVEEGLIGTVGVEGGG